MSRLAANTLFRFLLTDDEVPVNRTLAEAPPNDYDALLLPGGVMNPDKLRMNPKAVRFVKAFVDCRQADRGDLPRAVDADRSWSGAGADDDVVAFAADRSPERRRRLGDRESVVDNGLVTRASPMTSPRSTAR